MKSGCWTVRSLLVSVLFLLTATSSGLAATVNGTLTAAGQTNEHIITLPTPQTGARLVLSSATNTNFSFHTGTTGTAGSIASSNTKTVHTLNVLATNVNMVAGNSYHVRITGGTNATYPLTYTFTDDLTYARDLTWDPGTSAGGNNVVSNPDSAGGYYVYKLTTPASSAYGAWRSALQVTGGEASLELFKTTAPLHTTARSTNTSLYSDKIGSDGLVLAAETPPTTSSPAKFAANQTWYIRVNAQPGATWNLYSGDVYVHDLGTIAADLSGSSPAVTVGPEGAYYFRTVADATTPAWKLWQNGAGLPMLVSNASAPVSGVTTTYQQSETGQMLLVPPYLTSSIAYFVGISGAPGTAFTLTSQEQPVVDLTFGTTQSQNITGYGYTTYRVDVPPTVLGLQIDAKRTSATGNPQLYISNGTIPNAGNNTAFSEMAAGIDDSISIAPSTITDPSGIWYITVAGTGAFSYDVSTREPVVTEIAYITPSIINDDPNRNGWRYYRVSDINSQLGTLGWEILLDQAHRSGYEIALRSNILPSRWSSRTNDSATPTEWMTSHYSSLTGIMQKPYLQADIWYIGIYQPTQALGPFQLTTRTISAPATDPAQSITPVTGQDINEMRWFTFTIPADSNLKGWDLRLKTSAGNPQMVVRRNTLPGTLGDNRSNLQDRDNWYTDQIAGDQQWAGGISVQLDWTMRYNVSAAPVIADSNRYLIFGMGSPLEPGTYYVGVGRQTGSSDATPMSYTLESRGIGLPGSSYPIQITDLAFNGGSVAGSGLAPREVGWYRVTVPDGADSWALQMTPTVGEALMAVRYGALPNIGASSSKTSGNPTGSAGTLRSKSGADYFYKYAPTGQTAITSGEYYIAVVSEGQSPPNASTIGTGTVSYTLSSVGTMPVVSATPPTTLTVVAPISWDGQSVPYASQKAYRLRIPAGLTAVEVRLNNRVGNPVLAIRQDAADSGRLPLCTTTSGWYPDVEGGYIDSWRNTASNPYGSIVTISSPVAGDYTILVFADAYNNTFPDAAFDLEVAAVEPADLPPGVDGTGSMTVTNQDYQSWHYFRVVIPEDPNMKGWDLRLKPTAGSPLMVVRRDTIPTVLNSTLALSGLSTWASGSQWLAGTSTAIDWTSRYNNSNNPVTADPNRFLIMGMGSPLVAGTYYIGIASSSGTAAMSYTLESRAIGIGGSYPIQIADLNFSGGSVNGIGLPAREVGWYRVNVPAGATSWSLNLTPEGTGEAMLAVRHGRLPNINASTTTTSDNATTFTGITRQKVGNEYFYKFAPAGQATITAGEYYIAVISEGQSPPTTATIGSGSINYTLSSSGEMPIADQTSTPLNSSVPLSWVSQTVPYGSEKVYRFRVPAGIDSAEIRLLNKTGNPVFGVRRDAAGSGKIPNVTSLTNYPGPHEGGELYAWRNNALQPASNTVTIAPATEGDYTITVKADYAAPAATDATFDLEVVGSGAAILPFDNGTQNVTGQAYSTWRYFIVTVPNDAALKGWDLRLKALSGSPQMVIRRDQLPTTLTSTANLTTAGIWASGSQWGATPGDDWTGRIIATSPNISDKDGYLITGMGSPLEPGTYYVGITRTTGSSDTAALGYTLESRGIGLTGSAYPIQITDLNFNGGTANTTGLAPREVGWYRVTVPTDAASWALNLEPTLGEAMLAVRQGRLPNIEADKATIIYNTTSDHLSDFRGTIRQVPAREAFYKYVTAGQTTLTSGEYYIAVISEGQNPFNNSTIGVGAVDYTLTSVGLLPVADATVNPLGTVSPVSWTTQSVPFGYQKAYRFRVSAGLTAVELKLNNKSGNPVMAIRRDAESGGRIPDVWTKIKIHEGGDTRSWSSRADNSITLGGSLVTIPSPVAGDYTVLVAADSEYINASTTLMNTAGFDLEVRALTPTPLPADGGAAASGTLDDGQVAYYQVDIPAALDGLPPLGCLLKTTTSSGAVSLRIRQGQVPGDANTGSVVSANGTVAVVPPVLTAGTWYVEVKGTGITAYTLSSSLVTDSPARYSRAWTMPARIGSFTQLGVAAPFFGDSGIDDSGAPLPSDQGIDLETDGWHYYRITVPDSNSGLLRTELLSISGVPQIYLRAGALPGIDHYANPADPSTAPAQGQANAYDRYQTPSIWLGNRYNNWVPLDSRTETQLTPGTWWIGIRSIHFTSRYRLKVSTGDVHDGSGQRLDTVDYIQDLAQDGGSLTGQSLIAEDMRYYRVAIPQSSTVSASSTPLAWSITLNQTIGDAVVFIRDTLPPGQGSNGNSGTSAANSGLRSTYFQDWYDDNNPRSSSTLYTIIDAPGTGAGSTTTTYNLPPVEPGKVYYLGVYARSDSQFDISSSIGPERLALSGVIPFASGEASATLAAGEQLIYRIDVPANATVWQHTGSNNPNICFYLQKGSVPALSTADYTRCALNSTLTRDLTGYPWLPGNSYYLLVRNISAGSLAFGFTMSGQVAAGDATLTVTLAGSGSGAVNSTPNEIACTPTCSSTKPVGSTLTLNAVPGIDSRFSGWSGDCSVCGTTPDCLVTFDTAKVCTATFELLPLVSIDGDQTPYYEIGTALGVPLVSATVRAQALPDFLETITMTNPVSILFRGGYTDSGFTDIAQSGYTTISGWLKIRSGKLTAERLKIKP